jgi:hypothetical protein
MFPLSDNTLSLSQIADYWSREIRPPASALELLQVLEAAWWRAQIVGVTRLSRLELIRYLWRHSPSLDLVFVVDDEAGPPEIEQMTDGSVGVDLRPRLTVPSADPGTWDDTRCATAYEDLAQAQCLITDPTVGPALGGITLDRQEFMNWIEASGYPRPVFWGAPKTDVPGAGPDLSASDHDSKIAPPPKGRGGRKPLFDWGKIEDYVIDTLNKNGHWDEDPEDGWRSQNDLVVSVQTHFEEYYGEGKPSESAIKEHLPQMIAKWRTQSARN